METFRRSIILLFILACILTSVACDSEQIDRKVASDDFISESPIDMKGRTIKILYYDANMRPEFIFALKGDILKEFSDKMAEKYSCKIEVIEKGASDFQIRSEIKSGSYVADIIYYYYWFETGLMTPLDDYIDFNTKPFDSVEQNIALWHGKHYGMFIPVENNPYNGLSKVDVYRNLLTYNKKLLENAGLPDILELQETKQWTWDMFLNYAQRLTEDIDGDGINDIWGFAAPSKEGSFGYFLRSNNTYLVNDSDYDNTIYNLTSPEVIETFDFLHRLYYVDKVAYLPDDNIKTSGTILYNMLKNNKIAILTGSYVYDMDDIIGKAFYPLGPSANKYNCTFIKQGFHFIPKTAKNPEELAVILKELYYFADSTRKSKSYSNLLLNKNESLMEAEKFIFETALDGLNFQSDFYGDVIDYKTINSIISNPIGCEKILKDYEEELQKKEKANVNAEETSEQVQ